MSVRPYLLAAGGGLLLLLALAPVADGADSSPGREADDFSLLAEEQTVTAATKRPQPLSETPSEVTVIPANEIRAMGYHSLADALRWVRGLFVTDDRNYSYLGIRGVQRPGDYNDKVLVAIDGHTVNGDTFGDGPLGDELGLDLEQVERIEVVRGPGSTLYGSYAVLAVVNVVTRRPHALPGLAISGRHGGDGERRLFGAMASSRSGLPEVTVAGSALAAEGRDFRFPEFDTPAAPGGRAIGLDGSKAWSVSGSARWEGWSLAARTNRREKHVPTASYGTAFGDPRTLTVDGHDFVELSRRQPVRRGLELNARAYWDGPRYHGEYAYDTGAGRVVNHDAGNGDLVGTEWRLNGSVGARQVATGGIELQRHLRMRIENYDLAPYRLYVDRDVHGTQGAVYLQDELRLGPGLRLTAGSRLDAVPGLAPVVSPRLDLFCRTPSGTVVKILAGTAFRSPSVFERYYDDGYSQIANPDLEPERSATAEASVERSLGGVSAELTAYVTRIADLIDLVPSPVPDRLQYQNRDRVESRGLEGELAWSPAPSTRLRLAVACQRSADHATGLELSNSPRWNAHTLLVHDAGGPLTAGAGVRFLSPRRTLQGARTQPAIVTDGRIGVRAGHAEVSLEVRNLFDSRYGDPVSTELVQDQIEQDHRMLYLGLAWRQGPRP